MYPCPVGRDARAVVRVVVTLGALQAIEGPAVLSGVERDGALQRLNRGAQHRLPNVLGILPGQRHMPPGGGVVAQVERQAGQKVRELPSQQREVRPVPKTLPSVEQLLDSLPVIPHLWEKIGVWNAQAFQGEAFDVLIKLVEGQGSTADCFCLASTAASPACLRSPPAGASPDSALRRPLRPSCSRVASKNWHNKRR